MDSESARPGVSLFSATGDLCHLSFTICNVGGLRVPPLRAIEKMMESSPCVRFAAQPLASVFSLPASLLQRRTLSLRETRTTGPVPPKG